MSFRISSIYKSLVRHLVDTVESARNGGGSDTVQYHSWDNRGDESELPATDLIGLAGWSFHENRGLWMVHAGITISTFNDANLFREQELIDVIHDKWGEECPIPMRDPDTGDEYTQLVVKEFEMLPAGNSEKRNYRPIGLELKRTSA